MVLLKTASGTMAANGNVSHWPPQAVPRLQEASKLYRGFPTAWRYGGSDRMVLFKTASGTMAANGNVSHWPPQAVPQLQEASPLYRGFPTAWRYGGSDRIALFKTASGTTTCLQASTSISTPSSSAVESQWAATLI